MKREFARREGFTLIEVMTVLVTLALLAALTYTFFGSVIGDARASVHASQILKDLQSLETGLERYRQAHGAWPTGGAGWQTALVAEGYIKTEIPTPSAALAVPGGVYAWFPENYGELGGPSAAQDSALEIYGVSAEVCLEVQRQANNLSGAYHYDSSTPPFPADAPVWCESWGATPEYGIIHVVERL